MVASLLEMWRKLNELVPYGGWMLLLYMLWRCKTSTLKQTIFWKARVRHWFNYRSAINTKWIPDFSGQMFGIAYLPDWCMNSQPAARFKTNHYCIFAGEKRPALCSRCKQTSGKTYETHFRMCHFACIRESGVGTGSRTERGDDVRPFVGGTHEHSDSLRE